MNETRVTIRGRMVADADLKFTSSGAAVANLTIASNARVFDKTTNEWRDEPATFWRCSAWRDMAEAIAEGLVKGQAVIAEGVVKSREWTTKEGEKRTSLEIELDGIGADLRWARKSTASAPKSDPWGSTEQPW